MAIDLAVGTAEDIDTCADACNVADGWPAANGYHVGGGRHAVIPATWDGILPQPPGWSTWRAGLVDRGDGEAEMPLAAHGRMSEYITSLPPGPSRGELAAALARLRKETREDDPI